MQGFWFLIFPFRVLFLKNGELYVTTCWGLVGNKGVYGVNLKPKPKGPPADKGCPRTGRRASSQGKAPPSYRVAVWVSGFRLKDFGVRV